MASPEERQRYAALITQVLRGPGEFLSATQLAAVLPFETQRKDVVLPQVSDRIPPRAGVHREGMLLAPQNRTRVSGSPSAQTSRA